MLNFGKIDVGMKFGTYDAMVSERAKNYNRENDTECWRRGLESSYEFKDYATGNIKATACRTYSTKSKNEGVIYSAAAIFSEENYSWGTSAKSNGELLNKFDYIETQNQHAVDLNENGEVDNGEIFSGKLNREAYNRAKESGDLQNYAKYINQ